MTIEETLRRIGLSEQEIKVYTVLLRLNTATATKIATETDIDRATTYRFLSSLIEKGLVGYYIHNNVKYFRAANPTKLVDDLKEKLLQVQNIIPQLEQLKSISEEESRVELFKGKEGLKTIMKDILRTRKPYTFIGEVEKFFTELPPYIEQWLKQVEKLNIKGKLICNEEANFTIAKTESYKLISKNFISKISTWTYGNKTALFIWSTPPFGILIENRDVTHSNLALFNFLWSLARTPTKKHLEKTKSR